MAIFAHRIIRKPIVDLSSPHGNAFHLLSTARNLAPKYGLDPNLVAQEMMAGNYDHLVKVFDTYFGSEMDLTYNLVVSDNEDMLEIDDILEQQSIEADEKRSVANSKEQQRLREIQVQTLVMQHGISEREARMGLAQVWDQ